jgi:hypothetical protein
VGTLYGKTLNPRLKAAPDTIRVYEPPVAVDYRIRRLGRTDFEPGRLVDYERGSGWNKYLTFLGDDYPLAIISRPGAEGGKLLVFKDSYGNALIPFLAPHYREIHIIDPRYFEGDALAYAKSGDFDEVLFVNYFVVLSWYDGYARNLRRVTGPGASAVPARAGSETAKPSAPTSALVPASAEAQPSGSTFLTAPPGSTGGLDEDAPPPAAAGSEAESPRRRDSRF